MKETTNLTSILAFLVVVSTACFASGYQGGIAEAWNSSSIVVLGVPKAIDVTIEMFEENRLPPEGCYRLVVEKTYKSKKVESVIEFKDVFFHSSASLHLRRDSRHVIFIQTPEDRTRSNHPCYADIGDALTGLLAIQADGDTLDDIEAGLTIVQRYGSTPQKERRAFLLEHLPRENRYAQPYIVGEILRGGISEAIPYFRMKLSDTNDELQKLQYLSSLRILGEPNIRNVLIAWLGDPAFTRKGEIIEEMVRLKDPSLIPEIERFVHVEDEYIAVSARSALLRLGEPRAKELLFDMFNMSKDSIIRYNAIHVLNWYYTGDFSDKEKSMILKLRGDADETIARVAGFIADKWEQ